MHILIVDDDVLISACLMEILEDMGWKSSSSVARGAAAIEIAKTKRPCLAIVDLNLEGEMDGIETARWLHERLDTSIIFLSGTSDGALMERMRTVRSVGFIEKPFLRGEVKRTVSAALEGL